MVSAQQVNEDPDFDPKDQWDYMEMQTVNKMAEKDEVMETVDTEVKPEHAESDRPMIEAVEVEEELMCAICGQYQGYNERVGRCTSRGYMTLLKYAEFLGFEDVVQLIEKQWLIDHRLGVHKTCQDSIFSSFRYICREREREGPQRRRSMRVFSDASTRSRTSTELSDSTHQPLFLYPLYKNKCILCNKDFILYNHHSGEIKYRIVETLKIKSMLMESAKRRNDAWGYEVLGRLEGTAEEAKYHLTCKRNFGYMAKFRKAGREIQSMGNDQRHQRLVHLLDKSSVYVDFLQERIKQDQTKDDVEPKKPVHHSINNVVNDEDKENIDRNSSRTLRKRKNGTNGESNIIDKQIVIKKQKLNEFGDNKEVTETVRVINGKEISERQPALVTGAVLREYQLYGVTWLKTLHENGMNGILADEMGLGKTIQSISMIAALIENGVAGPFLCVAPLSTLPNWVHEFTTFAPEIPIVLFHASKDERKNLYKLMKKHSVRDQMIYPVFITSYEMCTIEFKFLYRWTWQYVVVDEGHKLKNINCRLIKTLKAFRSENRLLLTGTPLQNNLTELWVLLNFILPDIFNDLDGFQSWFDFSALTEKDGKEKFVAQEKKGQVLSKLHHILKPFLLRRLKTDVELSIPSKTEVHVYASMTELQELYYRAILDRKILDVLVGVEEETKLEESEKGLRKTAPVDYDEDKLDQLDDDGFIDVAKWTSIVQDKILSTEYIKQIRTQSVTRSLKVIWVQLKKACNHPYLMSYPNDENGYALIDDNVFKMSGKMLLLDRMLPRLIEANHKILIFSTMTKLLDIIEDYLSLRDWKSCRLDGATGYAERAENINKFQTDPEYKIFLLSTRAGGLGLNLMAADTVILFDSDWNPQCDLQAQDRAHRIGQHRKVMVYRFLSKNTVDQRIVEKAMGKRLLEKLVIHKGQFKNHIKNGTTITEEDLKELFQCDALTALQTRNTPEDILSEADLIALTDRENPLPTSNAYTVVESFRQCSI